MLYVLYIQSQPIALLQRWELCGPFTVSVSAEQAAAVLLGRADVTTARICHADDLRGVLGDPKGPRLSDAALAAFPTFRLHKPPEPSGDFYVVHSVDPGFGHPPQWRLNGPFDTVEAANDETSRLLHCASVFSAQTMSGAAVRGDIAAGLLPWLSDAERAKIKG